MQKFKFSFILILFIICRSASAQEVKSAAPAAKQNQPKQTKGSLSNGTIASQFDHIIAISNNYQDYKVIRKANLEKLRQNIADSLKSIQTKLADANAILNNHDNQVATLKDSLNQVQLELKNTKEQKESQNLLGMQLSKASYNAMVWSVIGILLILLIFYIYRYKQSYILTAEARKTLEETKEEFEQHRKRAMEREQKLNRRLQDELNKRL